PASTSAGTDRAGLNHAPRPTLPGTRPTEAEDAVPDQFGAYQSEIYLQGLADQVPPFTTNGAGLERVAAGTLTPESFGYVAGAAGAGATNRANLAAFERWRIVPRMLTGSSVRDLSTTLLGTALPAPVLLAPVGVQSILHPDGEL